MRRSSAEDGFHARVDRALARRPERNPSDAAGIPVAAGLLYPFTGLLMSPMYAAAAMSLSSVSVIANALRLRRTST